MVGERRLTDVQLVRAKYLPAYFRKGIKKLNAIIAIHSFTSSEPEEKELVEIKTNFIDYVLEQDPELPKRMANPK